MLIRLFILLVGALPLLAIDPVAKMYDDQLSLVENDVVSLAQAMPADKYDFVPKDGNFKDSRTFGEEIRHLATMIYMTAALTLEERSPYGPGTNNNGPDDIRTKEEVLRYLKASIAYGRKAMASLTEANHMQPVKSAFGAMPRSGVAAGMVFHSYDHYGQMVVYARLNGLVPPTSVPSSK